MKSRSDVKGFDSVGAEPVVNRLQGGGGGELLGEEDGQASLRPRAGNVEEVAIALEGVFLVGRNGRRISYQFEHLVEVV